ncbi:hypothetical protein FS842_003476 [Serendipita sp. 407]|nr:hypothetical protein FS842_003476 [Serendipita sp. 407]
MKWVSWILDRDEREEEDQGEGWMEVGKDLKGISENILSYPTGIGTGTGTGTGAGAEVLGPPFSISNPAQKMMKQLQGVPQERVAAILKPFKDLSAQYQTFSKAVDEHVRKHQKARVPIGNAAQVQENMRVFNSIISHFNMEQTILVQGQPIETFKLHQLSMFFDKSN